MKKSSEVMEQLLGFVTGLTGFGSAWAWRRWPAALLGALVVVVAGGLWEGRSALAEAPWGSALGLAVGGALAIGAARAALGALGRRAAPPRPDTPATWVRFDPPRRR